MQLSVRVRQSGNVVVNRSLSISRRIYRREPHLYFPWLSSCRLRSLRIRILSKIHILLCASDGTVSCGCPLNTKAWNSNGILKH